MDAELVRHISPYTNKVITAYRPSRVTIDEINDDIGFCIKCGTEAYNVEPDARQYYCESCEELGVYGLQELLLMGIITSVDGS